MRPLRYSINVTLDGCCDHRAIVADEDLHRHAVENLNRADALLFGWVTYESGRAARPWTLRSQRSVYRERWAPILGAPRFRRSSIKRSLGLNSPLTMRSRRTSVA